MTQESSDSSLLFSLAELERIERERIEGEALAAQHERQRIEGVAREAEAERRRVEQSLLARQREQQAELEWHEKQAWVRELNSGPCWSARASRSKRGPGWLTKSVSGLINWPCCELALRREVGAGRPYSLPVWC